MTGPNPPWRTIPVLRWRSDTPCFAGDGVEGDSLILMFGCEWIDDIPLVDTDFHITLRLAGAQWTTVLDHGPGGHWICLKPQVESMVAELNTSLESHSDYDLAAYLRKWLQLDHKLHYAVEQ